jgi:hypothetical protein
VKNSAKHASEVYEQHSDSAQAPARGYLPPFEMVLRLLGITHLDLNSSKVDVSGAALKFLISEVLRHVAVDEDWYFDRYLDVRAAKLSGDVKSSANHFRVSGYIEGRFPRPMPFDADFYFRTYSDLGRVFEPSDLDGLRRHFETRGYFEGRAGVAEHFEEAERWRAASNAKLAP